ncbi:class I SAM-dependent methyltransferase [Paenibacillus senegalensis]|uniref:class I SAM-dependent methyltransferase n=1 Tax=Paenibacillus senegalensis TaxID=1465766 RepID=UPI00028A2F86|nr:class I SAM-dependent methyltransferase [Paenibacillus senegalensis]
MSFSYYGELCTEVYDLTKKVGQSIAGDIDYYLKRLENCQGPILEAMAGSGRVLISLLEAGLQAEGVDYSPDMLASCCRRCEERGLQAKLYQSDLQTLSLPTRYEAILIPAGSFLLIENREQSVLALQRLYEHLQPGGRLLMDIFLPEPRFETGASTDTSTYALPNGDTITLQRTLVEADFLRQYTVTHLRYEKWRDGKLLQTELQRFALRWYGVEEFKLLLADIGFTDIVVSADFVYGQKPVHANQTFMFEAVRPL